MARILHVGDLRQHPHSALFEVLFGRLFRNGFESPGRASKTTPTAAEEGGVVDGLFLAGKHPVGRVHLIT